MDIPYLLLKSDSYETREVPESRFNRVFVELLDVHGHTPHCKPRSHELVHRLVR